MSRSAGLAFRALPSALALAFVLPCSGGCSVFFPSGAEPPPPPLPTHAVRANSVGYLKDRVKTVTIVLPPGMTSLSDTSADVRAAANDTVVWSCALTGPTTDPDTSATVYVGDFTAFDASGDYYISAPGLKVDGQPARSPTFRVGPDVFRDALTRAMLGMYGQRCGQAVSIQIDDNHWSHKACHLNDAYLNYLTGESTNKPSVGGWHDAGDYGKYVTNGAFTAGMLLAAWEHFQPMLSTLSIPAIPEHGGPIPDFLAEVKWELDWLLTTQGDDGGVSHKVTAIDFEPFEMPDKDGSLRYYTPVGTAATGDLVAVLAQAARIYAAYDQDGGGQIPGGGATRLHVPGGEHGTCRARDLPDLQDRRVRAADRRPQSTVGGCRAVGDDRRGAVPRRSRIPHRRSERRHQLRLGQRAEPGPVHVSAVEARRARSHEDRGADGRCDDGRRRPRNDGAVGPPSVGRSRGTGGARTAPSRAAR